MAELLNLRIGANNICSKYSANRTSKSRILFIAFLFCVFFFGNAKVCSQWNGSGTWNRPFEIWTDTDLITLANNVNAGIPYANTHFEVMQDITDTVRTMIGNDTDYFQGYLWGNNKKITVGINEDAQYVGLFSQLSDGLIHDLTIDGYVIGGLNSQYVGGFVGFVHPSGMSFHYCTNLSDVTGLSPTSIVGGVAGAIMPSYCATEVNPLCNNGTITGGFAIGGIFGAVDMSVSNAIMLHSFRNSGTIKSNDNVDISHYMAGIVAYVDNNNGSPTHPGHFLVHNAVNIGQVLSSMAMYAAGIIAHIDNSNDGVYTAFINSSSNSGFVDGALIAVGGIAGYIDNISIISCINTNWIEPTVTGQNSGAIVGFNNGTVIDCFYDKQMCVLDGIGFNAGVGNATGLPTTQMLGNNLPFVTWNTPSQLYPNANIASSLPTHPIDLLAMAPIYLRNTQRPPIIERLNNVQSDFTVSNNFWFPNFNPLLHPYDFPYRWESINGFINIPSTSNDATINNTGGVLQPDTLRVILVNEPLYEKLIPIWVIR